MIENTELLLNEQDNDSIGNRLKRCRKDAGLNQQEVAEACQITPDYYSRLERDDKFPGCTSTLVKLVEVLHTSMDYIVLGRTPSVYEPYNNPKLDKVAYALSVLHNSMDKNAKKAFVALAYSLVEFLDEDHDVE